VSVTVLPGVMTVPEAARHASVSPQTIRREIQAGRLRARYIGRLPRVLDEDLAAWLRADPFEARGQRATPPIAVTDPTGRDASTPSDAKPASRTEHPAGGEIEAVAS
jgi:excisionase family DNA binding protein